MFRRINLRSEQEIAKIAACGEIIAELFVYIQQFIREGVSTYELDKKCEKFMNDRGATCPCIGYGNPPYPAATCISINETIVHGIPSKRKILKNGDIVTIDVVCGKDSYMADACRTYAVGEISSEASRLITATETCFFKGLEAIRAGARVGDISSSIQRYAEDNGYSVIRELTGHGIGRDMHEAPDVPNYGKPGHGAKLEKGMVFCIEPMIACGSREIELASDGWSCIMADSRLSAHYENTIAIREDGISILTMSREDLDETKKKYPNIVYSEKN